MRNRATHVKESIQGELNVVFDHLSIDERDELCIIQHGRRFVFYRSRCRVLGIVDDLDGIVENQIIGNHIIPADQYSSYCNTRYIILDDRHVWALGDHHCEVL